MRELDSNVSPKEGSPIVKPLALLCPPLDRNHVRIYGRYCVGSMDVVVSGFYCTIACPIGLRCFVELELGASS